MKRTLNIVTAVAADIIEDCSANDGDLASAQEILYGTINKILYDDLGLVNKLARYLPRLLCNDQKND
jgi:hypothetical protein